MDWPRQARARESSEPVGKRVGQQGIMALACHIRHARRVGGGSSPKSGEEWREGVGSCPPMGEPSRNLVEKRPTKTRCVREPEMEAHADG